MKQADWDRLDVNVLVFKNDESVTEFEYNGLWQDIENAKHFLKNLKHEKELTVLLRRVKSGYKIGQDMDETNRTKVRIEALGDIQKVLAKIANERYKICIK